MPTLTVGIGSNEAAIDGKALTADQTLGEATLDRYLEQTAQQIAVAKAAVSIFGEGRVIGHGTVETELAEPTVAEVEVDLLAQTTL